MKRSGQRLLGKQARRKKHVAVESGRPITWPSSVTMMRNEGQIRAHLTKNHNMTMEDYAAKFVHGKVADEITHFLDAAPTQAGEQGNEDLEVPRNVMWYNRSVIKTWDNIKICLVIFIISD